MGARPMHRDTVIGIVGVVILVSAMVGVFTYERGQAAGISDGTGVGTMTLAGPSLDGTLAVGASADETITLNQTGMTNITFTLTWTATNGVDTMRLSVAPSAETLMTTGASSDAETDGEITLTIPVPNTLANGATGVGAWQVSVEFVSASTGLPAEPPVPPPGSTDAEVAWSLATSIDAIDTGA